MKYVVVAIYPNEIEAHLAQSTLAASNIEAFLKYDDVGGMYPAFQFIRGVQLLVQEEDLEEARRILGDLLTKEDNCQTPPNS